jgi:hypothetical protein
VPSFDRIRYRHHDESVFLYPFDLIELNATTCVTIRPKSVRRRWPMFWTRLATASQWAQIEEDGPTVFRDACKFGPEVIVSKRKDSALSPRPP